MAAKKTTTAVAKAANCMVEIKASVKFAIQELYIVGSAKSLGNWDASKALKMEFCSECGCFYITKKIPEGEKIEFKFLASPNWASVEKGMFNEEIGNHEITSAKGATVTVDIYNFTK